MEQNNILEMAQGAIIEQVDIEVTKVIENILNPNTNPVKKRTVTVTVVFSPSADRTKVGIKATAKSKLEPNNAIETALLIGMSGGNPVAQEMTAQIPGQISINGNVQEKPKLLKLVVGGKEHD